MSKSSQNTYWPHMIIGFVVIGVVLGYWTIKNSLSIPVHESNKYMMKYQDVVLEANEIIEARKRFDKLYNAKLLNFKKSDFQPKHLKREIEDIMALSASNTFEYKVTTKDGKGVDDADVTILITRPHTEKEDQLFKNIKGIDGIYRVQNVKLKSFGRYIIRVKIEKGDAIYFDKYRGIF